MEERITGRKNPLIQKVRRLATSASERRKERLFLGDGTKLLEEAVRYWPGLDTVILADEVEAEVPESVRLVRVPREIMEYISPMETPQGAVFLCRLPEKTAFVPKPGMLVLDGIQDPGNLGTILRTADAMEIPVVLTPGCADAYNPKTVRAAMGAVFRSQPQWTEAETLLETCRQRLIPLYVTALSERAVDLRQADLRKAAMVIGSEGRGVGEFFLTHADRELIIPMNPRCESLNAAIAAAIVMWEMRSANV